MRDDHVHVDDDDDGGVHETFPRSVGKTEREEKKELERRRRRRTSAEHVGRKAYDICIRTYFSVSIGNQRFDGSV